MADAFHHAACWLAAACLIPALTAQQKGYVGASVCGSCHTMQLAQQSASEHARSLAPVASHRLAKSFRGVLPRQPNFALRFSEDFTVRVSDSKNTFTVPLQWAFGAGDQAVTFVSRLDEDRYIEHHFSYYSAIRSLDATPGHRDLPAKKLVEAAGVIYKTFDPDPKIMRCFQCHSTGPLSLGPKLEIQPAENGVRCEVCHGPGSLHVAAVRRGEVEAARKLIDNPRRLSAAEINSFCGDCHRQPAPPGAATNWNDPWNVRHQPLYLAQSVCFLKSQGRLSCLTCHDPHKPLVKNDKAHYNGGCAGCHRVEVHPKLKVAITNCIGCHMPQVAPQAHLRFTNHWIGVYKEGGLLRPVTKRLSTEPRP